jgi:hypothetical protein
MSEKRPNWQGRVELDFGGEERVFQLRNRELFALQDKTGVGPAALWRRIQTGDWRLEDLRETIRFGLEGGGMRASEAGQLLAAYVDQRPRMEAVPVALAILNAALWLPEELTVKGKAEGDGTLPTTDSLSP